MSIKQFAPMIIVMALNKMDIESMGILNELRIGFVSVIILCMSLLGVIYMKTKSVAESDEKIKVPAQMQWGQEVAPGYESTAKEYDQKKILEVMKQVGMGACIVGCIHAKWGYIIPLAVQIIMTPMTVCGSPLFQIYILGKEAKGDLKRPFPDTSNPLASLAGGDDKATEKKDN